MRYKWEIYYSLPVAGVSSVNTDLQERKLINKQVKCVYKYYIVYNTFLENILITRKQFLLSFSSILQIKI